MQGLFALINENPLICGIAAVVATLGIFSSGYVLQRIDHTIATAGSQQGKSYFFRFVVWIIGGLVAIVLAAQISATLLTGELKAGFGSVAGLVLIGFAIFLGILTFMAKTMSTLGILDARQPLGLPDGSVRAILTIAFIILVGVLSAFLVTGYQNRVAFETAGLMVFEERFEKNASPQTEKAKSLAEKLREQHKADAIISVESLPEKTADGKEFIVQKVRVHSRIDSRVADDIAKQTLTMISTILAAMIGFYFALRSNEGGDKDSAAIAALRAETMEHVTKSKTLIEEVEARLPALRTAAGLATATQADKDALQKVEVAHAALKEKLLNVYPVLLGSVPPTLEKLRPITVELDKARQELFKARVK